MNGVEINTRAYVATRLLLRWDYLYAMTLKTKVFGDYNHARLEVSWITSTRGLLLRGYTGSSYQEAHGRPGAAQTAADQSGTLDYMSEVPRSVDQATTSVWRVTVEDTRKKIAEMEMPKRRAFVLENRLCFNCLKPGHQVTHCRSFKRCQVCH